MSTTTRTARPASERQQAFITRLLSEKETAGTAYEGWTPDWTRATAQAASAVIDYLLTLPAKAAAAEAEPGFYVRDGQAFKVQQNKAGTHTYALIWSGSSWDYQPGAGRNLAGLVPMTAEQAAALGLASGRCINCCRTLGGSSLSAKVSALIGYGETCARHNGWTYPTGAKAQRAYIEEAAPEMYAEMVAADKAAKEQRANEQACSPGQSCDTANLSLCSKHSMEYQTRYGRAYNE